VANSNPPKGGRPLGHRLSEQSRSAIQATNLVKRLQKHALGDLELSMSQIRAIEVLLKKTLPDLSSVELTGDADNPVKFQGVIDLVRPG
jgi:hypothetical protein